MARRKKYKNVKMTLLDQVTGSLALVGGLNWLLPGLSLLFGGLGKDPVTSVFGVGVFSGVVFTAVGVSSVYFLIRVIMGFK